MKHEPMDASDELAAEVGDGPTADELNSDAEVQELVAEGLLNIVNTCVECNAELDVFGECLECEDAF